ncbi:MAG: hypothetical protein LQ342_003012 [Letrouitia transgressa]|nr:MAG: hypothetical protein LQ342_003012 [Letrouitia transgressa]
MAAVVNKIRDKISRTSVPPGHHLAAVLNAKDTPLELTHRCTPTPGPDELLIDVKSVALNPVDHVMRDTGMLVSAYPTVLGSDVAGTVLSAGSSVGPAAPKPGTRVAAFASAFYFKGAPDYGGLQTRVVIPAYSAVTLPQRTSFNKGSLLPMAVLTAFSGFNSIGVPLDTVYTAVDRPGLLVWGGASSVGSAVVQVARTMGFRVYATASLRHSEYLQSLGATRVFDYKDTDVEGKIVSAVKEDGATLRTGYLAAGPVQPCVDILKELKGDATAKLASAPPMFDGPPKVEGVETTFVQPPSDPKERGEHMHFIFNVWLREKLESGEFVPSPGIQSIDGGLESADKALNELKKGVSGVKLVLEL